MLALSTFQLRPTSLVRILSILACAGGVGVWGALLLAPAARTPPPGLTVVAPVRGDTAVLAQWFGASAAPLRVAVVGLIAAGDRGAALLRVEGGVPTAYRVGQQIGQGATLARVERNAVVIDTGGDTLRIAVSDALPLGSPGFVRVRPAQAQAAAFPADQARGAASVK
ncbi:MAG: type II secretion system protein N [Burkholderiaceae bacterium]